MTAKIWIGVAAFAALGLAAPGPASAQDSDYPQQPLTDRQATVDSALSTPAKDLNLKKTPIPEVLQRAVVNAYDLATLNGCQAIGAEVARLDGALGADKDLPPPPDSDKKDVTASSALKAGVEAIEPYRGIVRFVTGANSYDKQVQEAVEAGFARRGFLKGVALAMNCAPPASPAWYVPAKLPDGPQPYDLVIAPNGAPTLGLVPTASVPGARAPAPAETATVARAAIPVPPPPTPPPPAPPPVP